MNRLVVVGIIVLLIAVLGALGVVAWNLNTLAQAQANAANVPYGRGMMGGYQNPDNSQGYNSSVPYGPGGMMRGVGMMGRFGNQNVDGTNQNCPCFDNGGNQANPSTTVVPTSTPAPKAGNSSSAASSSASASSKPANAMTAKAGNLNVTLVMTPPPAAFSSTTFDITITDEKSDTVSDAKVSLDLTMPSMWMPSNKPQAQSLGNGKYQATGRFTMRGGWRIDVIIDRGGQKQNAYFDIGL